MIGNPFIPESEESMENKPFWETAYSDLKVSAFSKGPTADVEDHFRIFPSNANVLDVGCGEGRNSVFMAKLGNRVDAFDISAAGIEKARWIAEMEKVSIRFFVCDLADFVFEKPYDIILSHGVLHLPYKETRDSFIRRMQENTTPGGINVIGIFTNRLPATPDNAPFTHSLFDVGELPAKYTGWELLYHAEGTFRDSHPGGIHHEHAYERIIARKPR